MKPTRLSLRSRIFIFMILFVLVVSVLIAIVTIIQYSEQSDDYNNLRLERKENQIKRNVDFIVSRENANRDNLDGIFKDEIDRISYIHSVDFNLYSLEGDFLLSSQEEKDLAENNIKECLNAEILNQLREEANPRHIDNIIVNGIEYLSSYTYIRDNNNKPVGILNLSYISSDEFSNMERNDFLMKLGLTYIVMFLVAIIFAYFMSKYITKSLKSIGEKLDQTRLHKRNEKIIIDDASEEIYNLVNAYNGMIDELEESAVKLAKSEREQAWREMAKQVAHEIKNPLTPMRLSVQSFQRKFDPEDPNIHQKVGEYTKTLIQQIDTMSSIASAFSNFAKMPAQQKETLNVVEITRLALDIFNEKYIHFSSKEEEIIAKFDRTQLIRVVTNLIKNAIQAIPEHKTPHIDVTVQQEGDNIKIQVSDNGVGITKENVPKIFEPKFTTKTSGMGLGLGMVKNIVETYEGSITFTSQENEGTTFTVMFPKI